MKKFKILSLFLSLTLFSVAAAENDTTAYHLSAPIGAAPEDTVTYDDDIQGGPEYGLIITKYGVLGFVIEDGYDEYEEEEAPATGTFTVTASIGHNYWADLGIKATDNFANFLSVSYEKAVSQKLSLSVIGWTYDDWSSEAYGRIRALDIGMSYSMKKLSISGFLEYYGFDNYHRGRAICQWGSFCYSLNKGFSVKLTPMITYPLHKEELGTAPQFMLALKSSKEVGRFAFHHTVWYDATRPWKNRFYTAVGAKINLPLNTFVAADIHYDRKISVFASFGATFETKG